MISKILRPLHKDLNLILIEAILIFIGVVMIYSASYYYSAENNGDGAYFLKKQIFFLVLALVTSMIVNRIPLKIVSLLAMLGYFVSCALLIWVDLKGEIINGARRWIVIAGIQFQPSELAKIVMILVVAYLIVRYKKALSGIKGNFIFLGIVGVPVILTGLEDVSTAGLMIVIIFGIYYIGVPNSWRLISILGVLGVIVVSGFLLTGGQDSFRHKRIQVYLEGPQADPTGFGYQVIHSLDAIGSGGLIGEGLGRSMEKVDFLPEAHNDIIFAIICEEIGFIGGIIVIGLLFLLILRILAIGRTVQDPLASLIVFGIAIHMGVQAFINIGVATATLPVTGMTLPFISYGGTSLILFIIEVGFVQRAFHEQKLAMIVKRKKQMLIEESR